MYVSSKMVFHLADSFYYALKNVAAVAIEINPAIWQKEMVNLERLQHNLSTNFSLLKRQPCNLMQQVYY